MYYFKNRRKSHKTALADVPCKKETSVTKNNLAEIRPILFSLDQLLSKLLRWSLSWEELTQDRSKWHIPRSHQRLNLFSWCEWGNSLIIIEGDKRADEKRYEGSQGKLKRNWTTNACGRTAPHWLICWHHVLLTRGRHFLARIQWSPQAPPD